ncbi:MAG: ABC transporter ATP-binding protein/permease [Lachnospiraceae bacterium]|nr:ABC transporter ATP-binding protein/permease [Lachnospiraceae bacterium]
MKENLKKLVQYYKPYLGVFWADMFFAVLQSGTALVLPLIIRRITGTVIYMERQEALTELLYLALIMLALVLLSAFCNYYISYYGHVMGARIEYDMRAEIFNHYQKLSFSFYDDEKVGQLMSRITSDLFDITELLHHGPENIIISVIKIVGALMILCSISPKLALAAFIMVPVMVVYAWVVNKYMMESARKNRARLAEINAQIEDNLSGIRVVKSFANEDIECRKFAKGNDEFLDSKKERYFYMGIYNGGMSSFSTLIQILVVTAGAYLITGGTLDVTDLLTFLLYIGVFTDPIKTLINFTEQFQSGYSGYERFLEIMAIEPDIQDAPDAVEAPAFAGDISFDRVSFAYNDHAPQVLKHVSLDIPAGSYVALVGSSGAGKTTLCSLIPRFYDIEEGSITIDGMDIRGLTLNSLRKQIGIVQQDVYLFAGTVYENILYGRPDATKEEVIAAAVSANAHEFIMSLPEGYETDIGQRGIKLSGGQKQRISIARVFLKNPPILIFDEATSSLDNESERVVQESLEKLAQNRTTLVIAHRLSTIRNAGRILVLTEDGIAEEGTHEELLEKKGIYEKLYHMR